MYFYLKCGNLRPRQGAVAGADLALLGSGPFGVLFVVALVGLFPSAARAGNPPLTHGRATPPQDFGMRGTCRQRDVGDVAAELKLALLAHAIDT